ncbi:hypothetical protein SteCoe_28840 [Stentor coeruleus]|uniref:RING-type domain-containing protein n=1 Tax=Stentor coeruleus TaxID=5963 RepID=A0A1R2B7C8_9CILI|nr:hypothetical protein SteCoe_28840 [Stentor coeruleus]
MNICYKCKLPYDSEIRIPKILPCGHGLCIICIEKLFKKGLLMCPKDNIIHQISLEDISTNYVVLEAIDIGNPFEIIKCTNGHEMNILVQTEKEKMKCSVCKKYSDSYYQCVPCLDQICIKCCEWINTTAPNSYRLRCSEGHYLRETLNAEVFYQSIRPHKKHNFFLCDGCLTKTNGRSLQCRQCKLDYCISCVEKYRNLDKNIELLFCSKKNYEGFFGMIIGKYELCNQRLVWRNQNTNFKCFSCGSFFNKSGSFICKECSIAYCISCANKLIP